jgi:hypothetical protein
MTTHNNSSNGFARDYNDVANRIREFRAKHPDGSLRPVNPEQPVTVIEVGGQVFLQYVAAAYRGPEDKLPGIGVAWETFPGRTPFTKGSEAMVAETSAWGRAIVAALAADTKNGVASSDEVRAAQARREPVKRSAIAVAIEAPDDGEPVVIATGEKATDAQVKKIGILRRELELDDSTYRDRLGRLYGVPSAKDLTTSQASDLIEKLSAAKTKRG